MGTDDYGGKDSGQQAQALATASTPVLPATADAEAEAERTRLVEAHTKAVQVRQEAERLLAQAKEEEAAAHFAAQPVADPFKEVLVDLGADGTHAIVAVPTDADLNREGLCRERTLTISGRRVEHVGEVVVVKDGKPYVVWTYRAM